jgi:hypothetical protein
MRASAAQCVQIVFYSLQRTRRVADRFNMLDKTVSERRNNCALVEPLKIEIRERKARRKTNAAWILVLYSFLRAWPRSLAGSLWIGLCLIDSKRAANFLGPHLTAQVSETVYQFP